MITEFAPAKVNLALHVTGRRADGYHLLDSLVVFADVGDHVTVAHADTLSLAVTGSQSADLLPVTDENLVLRAARAFGPGQGARITLEKVLPVASGIGGGSADAAATLRALALLWQKPLPDTAALLALGADLPVCLAGKPARMQGIGEVVQPLAYPLPPAWLVLVNPRMPLSTPSVFAALNRSDNKAMLPMPPCPTAESLAQWLQSTRNDLQSPAIVAAPAIAKIIAALGATDNCLLARMSGSGATCFGLYATADDATTAANHIRASQPQWWVAEAQILG